MRQIPLELGFSPRFGAEDFLVAPSNERARATLQRWPDWPDKVMILVGPEDSGKTHLASIWGLQSAASSLSMEDVERAVLSRVAPQNCVIEGAEHLGPHEATLFHFLNATRESGRFTLLTARSAPDLWGIRTPDLLSRLRLAPMLRLDVPDDALVRAVLIKLFADRQLAVDQAVIDYLVIRMERSIAAARRLVAALDQSSLANARRITRATAAEVLAALEQDESSRHGDVTGLGQNRLGS